MVKVSHVVLPVADPSKSRDWYVNNLGFELEFEREDVAAVKDTAGLTIFLQKSAGNSGGERITLTIQVENVDAKYKELSDNGVEFASAPKRQFWGYGAEVLDPDGYINHLWDEVSMREMTKEPT